MRKINKCRHSNAILKKICLKNKQKVGFPHKLRPMYSVHIILGPNRGNTCSEGITHESYSSEGRFFAVLSFVQHVQYPHAHFRVLAYR